MADGRLNAPAISAIVGLCPECCGAVTVGGGCVRCGWMPGRISAAAIVALLGNDEFRYSLHDWFEDEVRKRGRRSPSDDVTDILAEICARLESACAPPAVVALPAGGQIGRTP